MAKIKGTAAVANIRGSTGDSTFQLWRAGINILRDKPTLIHNPQSTRQNLVRNAMDTISHAWNFTLDQDKRDSWETYAIQQKQKATGDGGTLAIIRGNTGAGTGYHAYVSLRLAAFMSFQLPNNDVAAPLDEPLPENNTEYSVEFLLVPVPNVTVTWTESAQHAAISRTRFWLWNPTRTFHKQLQSSVGVTAETTLILGGRSANGISTLFSSVEDGTPLHFQMDVINASGQRSPPSQNFRVEKTS